MCVLSVSLTPKSIAISVLYALPSREDAELLTALPEFVRPYRKGLVLVARGWGWDLEKGRWVSPRTRPTRWTGRPVRLYKMGRCVNVPQPLHLRMRCRLAQ